jgi:heptosyltransferase-2
MAEPRLEVFLTDEERAGADDWWRSRTLEASSVVALHPGSGTFSLARRWPAERYAVVGAALAGAGHRVLVIAGPGEEALAEEVRAGIGGTAAIVAPQTTPRHLGALLRRCDLFVGNDSGVMHLAATVGVPTVGVFGLTNHRAWGPYPPDEHRVARLELPCSPCLYPGHGLGAREGCPPRMCLETLEPSVVVEAARDLLKQRVPSR